MSTLRTTSVACVTGAALLLAGASLAARATDQTRPAAAAATPAPARGALADAAMRDDLAGVRALLARGADVASTQGDGMTALHWAAERGRADIADVLLTAGAAAAPRRASGATRRSTWRRGAATRPWSRASSRRRPMPPPWRPPA